MEPGHEDREYVATAPGMEHARTASMEPGHEDREYGNLAATVPTRGL